MSRQRTAPPSVFGLLLALVLLAVLLLWPGLITGAASAVGEKVADTIVSAVEDEN